MHRIALLAGMAMLLLAPLFAQPNLSGKWIFNPSKSQNIGMMAEMKLVATVKQSAKELTITNVSLYNGHEQTSTTHLDLTGKTVQNKTPMEQTADTVTKWEGDKLVTTWITAGSIAGSTSVRTETRSLSADGKVLTVESAQGKSPAMVMVYDRQ